MNRYLVGGAVRDGLLQRAPRERDWVVVGSSEQEMLDAGFVRVGQSFPVFLHPRTREQHALARGESKTGRGHRGFSTWTEGVTLEDDLRRRDLTVNAMAMDESGRLIDPWGGERDIGDRVLRHVSNAFGEDPLRVYRVARFAAELPGFRVAPETLALLQSMAPGLEELSGERVWNELSRASDAPEPARFFEVLLEGHVAVDWFGLLDLPRLIELVRRRSLSGDAVFGAMGYLQGERRYGSCRSRLVRERLRPFGDSNSENPVSLTLNRLRAPSRTRELAGDVEAFSICRLWMGEFAPGGGSTAPFVLDFLEKGVGALRPGDRFAHALKVVVQLTDVCETQWRCLVESLRAVRPRGSSGEAARRSIRDQRLAVLEHAVDPNLLWTEGW